MSKLNNIEEQLKKKCQEEIAEVVKDFIDNIMELDKLYSNGINSYYFRKDADTTSAENRLYIQNESALKSLLKRTLEETFLDGMMRKKSKQLLDKLELI